MMYFAYGSNMNVQQMARRCPNAVPMAKLSLPNWKLKFSGVATIVPDDDNEVHGALWWITNGCRLALDRYEGYNTSDPSKGLYNRIMIKHPKIKTPIMTYVMNGNRNYAMPSDTYFYCIMQGFEDFGWEFDKLHEAYEEADRMVAKQPVEYVQWWRRSEVPRAACGGKK